MKGNIAETRAQKSENRKSVVLRSLVLIVCATVIAPYSSAVAQQTKKIAQIGYLSNRSSSGAPWMDEFRAGLSELGYVEGRNITIEYRFWDGKLERVPELAAELVRLNCDVLLTGGVEATEAAKNATKTIPIVMAFSGAEPVGRGIITSLARPGGNITGLASVGSELSGKRLEILKQVIPKLSRVAMLSSPTTAAGTTGLEEAKAAARFLGVTIHSFEVKTRDDLDAVFKTAAKERAGALIVQPGGFVGSQAKQIVELAEKIRLPAIYPSLSFTESGALMVYAEDRFAQFRRAAWYVDRILRGAKPADLPAEQPKKFFLVINLNAAKRISLTIPPAVLARADKVIK